MPKKQETKIQDRVRLELSKKGCKVFRCNVGNFYTKYGQEIKIGTPVEILLNQWVKACLYIAF